MNQYELNNKNINQAFVQTMLFFKKKTFNFRFFFFFFLEFAFRSSFSIQLIMSQSQTISFKE